MGSAATEDLAKVEGVLPHPARRSVWRWFGWVMLYSVVTESITLLVGPRAPVFPGILSLVLLVVGAVLWSRRRSRREKEGTGLGRLRAQDGSLWFNDVSLGRIDKLSNGCVAPDDSGSSAWLAIDTATNLRHVFRTSSVEAAERILSRLGLGLPAKSITVLIGSEAAVRSASPCKFVLSATLVVPIVIALALVIALPRPLALQATLLCNGSGCSMLFTAILAPIPTRVVIGRDGVLLRWMGITRFLSFDKVTSVEDDARGIALVRHDGARWIVPFPTSPRTARDPRVPARLRDDRRLVREQIAAMLAARQRGPSSNPSPLSRQSETGASWASRLRSLLGRDGYRETSLTPEQLWAIIEDPASTDEARAAAAVALGPTLDDRGRERLDRVLAAVASPPVRVVLEQVRVGADDARVAEALEQVPSRADGSHRNLNS